MGSSLYLGRLFGIRLKIHFTFLLIFLYVGYYSFQQYHSWVRLPMDCLFVCTAFLFVVMHEFGHALAARRVGIQTHQILILPIGGMAQLNNMPEKPGEELFVTICGPLVNLGLVLICLPFFLINHSLADFYNMVLAMGYLLFSFINPAWLGHYSALMPEGGWLADAMSINIILFIFNLMPAFPIDGGRIFRALLAFRFSYKNATTIAARTGQVIASLGIAYILYSGLTRDASIFSLIKMLALCIFIIVLAQMEYRMVKRKADMGYYLHPDMGFGANGTLHVTNHLHNAMDEIAKDQSQNVSVFDQAKSSGIHK